MNWWLIATNSQLVPFTDNPQVTLNNEIGPRYFTADPLGGRIGVMYF